MGKGKKPCPTVPYRAITVQGLPCRYRAIPCPTFISILNTMYLVNSVYLDIRWVTTCFLVIIYHFHTLKWTVHWQVQPCLPCITVVGPCSTVQYRGSTVVGPCSTVSYRASTVSYRASTVSLDRALPCSSVSLVVPSPSCRSWSVLYNHLSIWECGTKCRPITARIKINANATVHTKTVHDGQVLVASAFLLRPPNLGQILIKDAAKSRDFNAKQSQSHPKMEAEIKLKEKRIGGCLPNV